MNNEKEFGGMSDGQLRVLLLALLEIVKDKPRDEVIAKLQEMIKRL